MPILIGRVAPAVRSCSFVASFTMSEAFVTLATNDEYSCGALVLADSLRKVSTTKKLVCMITNTVSDKMREILEQFFDHVESVDVLNSNDSENLKLLARPDLGVTFTKLHCWRLTQYSKCVFMDADTLVLQNIDDLFEREELSAAPDPGWPDCFNSGVFVFTPSLETYRALLDLALSEGSFDGGDQGLLNLFFSDWSTKDIRRHLPFTYNCIAQAFYSYPPAMKRFASQIRVVHFIGAAKPWHQTVNTETGSLTPCDEISAQSLQFLNHWWHLFFTDIKPKINPAVFLPTRWPLFLRLYVGVSDVDDKQQFYKSSFDPLTECKDIGDLMRTMRFTHQDRVRPCQGGLVGHLATLEVTKGPIVSRQSALSPVMDRQGSWERGEIDYTGVDRFSNIRATLDKHLG